MPKPPAGSSPVLLQPLRIPPCWRVDWNTLCELDPTEENVRAGFFRGSSLFLAAEERLRLLVDLEWIPEDDPAGEYRLSVHYAPWERTAKGRRRKGEPLNFRNAKLVHEYRTRSRADLVRELEAALSDGVRWTEHN